MAGDEQVLVVPREVIERVGAFHGLMFDVDRYRAAIFENGCTQFMTRSEAETNPAFKQLIPYVIMGCGGRYLSYVRGKRGGEARLIGSRSIGIGGHINPVDDMPLFGEVYDTYLAAVEREVDEEVNVRTPHTNRIVAMLNDDSNAVGSVHLGIVHFWALERPDVVPREQMITQMGFMTAGELRAETVAMETWSALCVEGIEQIETRGTAGKP